MYVSQEEFGPSVKDLTIARDARSSSYSNALAVGQDQGVGVTFF